MITEVQYEGVGATRFLEFALPAMLNLDQVSVATYRFNRTGGYTTSVVDLDQSSPVNATILDNTSPDGIWRYVVIEMPVDQPSGGRYGVALVWNCADGTTGVTDFVIYGSSSTAANASLAVDGPAQGELPHHWTGTCDRARYMSFRGRVPRARAEHVVPSECAKQDSASAASCPVVTL